jgi:hypothetical protein
VVRIVVDDDVVRGPVPVAYIIEVVGGYAEVESAEPETAWAAATETPDVSAANLAGEMSVLPRMIEMIVGVAGSGVADPCVIAVNVRGVGMARLVYMGRTTASRLSTFVSSWSRGAAPDGWTMRGDMASANLMGRGSRLVSGSRSASLMTASGSASLMATLLGECSN